MKLILLIALINLIVNLNSVVGQAKLSLIVNQTQVTVGSSFTVKIKVFSDETSIGTIVNTNNLQFTLKCLSDRCLKIIGCQEDCLVFNQDHISNGLITKDFYITRSGSFIMFLSSNAQIDSNYIKVDASYDHNSDKLGLALGIIYLFAWSSILIILIYANYRLKRGILFSLSTSVFIFTASSCYLLFNFCLYFVPSFQAEYTHHFKLSYVPVSLIDLIFSMLLTLLSLIIFIQCLIYNRNQNIGRFQLLTLFTIWLTSFLILILAIFKFSNMYFIWFQPIIAISVILTIAIAKMRVGIKLGYVSSMTTTISYLTLIGGFGSLSWILVFYYNKGDIYYIFGNPIRLFLGIASLVLTSVYNTLVRIVICFREDSRPINDIVVSYQAIGTEKVRVKKAEP